jgi:hypothetical protein
MLASRSTTVVGCRDCERCCEESRHEGMDDRAMSDAVSQALSCGWHLVNVRNRREFLCPGCYRKRRTESVA